MKIKVYGWDGRKPDRSTWEIFEGGDALQIVRAMMATPFAANQTPRQFMASSLAALAKGGPALPDGDGPAADAYLSRLANVGLAEPA
jgi:hypothetical protein